LSMTLFQACAKSEIARGGLKFVNVGGKDLVIANVDGKFYSIDNWCTHEQGNLSDG
jgi:nitrite reductase/ring-hydroxylating ferredoxin subunit